MGDEGVIDKAMTIIESFQVLPRLVVFDLDFTLWPCYCESRSEREMPSLFPHAEGILYALRDNKVDVAIASGSPAAGIAITLLEKLEVSSMFVHKEIFPSLTFKTEHFQNIHTNTGIPFNSMLFFDDEERNIGPVTNLGVTSILVHDGVDLEALRQGLAEFQANYSED